MALVQGPAQSLNASGNLGSICYTTWRGIQIARDAWTGTVPNTSLQVTQQGKLTTIAQAWSGTLSESERDEWRELAISTVFLNRFGDPYTPTGYHLFLKRQLQRSSFGGTLQRSPIPREENPVVMRLKMRYEPAGPRIRFTLSDTLAGDTGGIIGGFGLQYFVAGPFDTPGRVALPGEYRLESNRIPPSVSLFSPVTLLRWYWGKSRVVFVNGEVGNWFYEQVETD